MAIPAPIELSTLGMADSLILMVLALVVFGPRKLPQIGRQLGKLMYEFRKASNDFKFQMEEELRMAEDADRKKKEEAERQRVLTEQAAVHALPAGAGVQQLAASTLEPAQEPALVDPTVEPALNPLAEPTLPRLSAPVTGPVLQPPSTGEVVAAARPAAIPAAVFVASEPSAESVVTEAVSPETRSAETLVDAEDSAATPTTPTTETVTQHG
jgi:sec-independent protein translocase protein TatB